VVENWNLNRFDLDYFGLPCWLSCSVFICLSSRWWTMVSFPHRNGLDSAERVTNWGIPREFLKGMYLPQKTYQFVVKTTKNFWITKMATKHTWLSYCQPLKNNQAVFSYFLNSLTERSCSCKHERLSDSHRFISRSYNLDFHVLNFKSLPNCRGDSHESSL
jgi:hypothetical protein